MAAPLTPSRNTNMKIGSSIIFVTSPATGREMVVRSGDSEGLCHPGGRWNELQRTCSEKRSFRIFEASVDSLHSQGKEDCRGTKRSQRQILERWTEHR